MIPGWKVRRELGRLAQQARAIPELFFEPVMQRRHDRLFASRVATDEGAIACGEKVAVVLIFQPLGIAESVFGMIAHLVGRGYAPLVVSNTPLAACDRERLRPICWRMAERPNYGYDFGGYRDAILLLDRWQVAPERLLILNDSIWFPLWEDETLIRRLEDADADVAGTILRNRDGEHFLESYCYMIRGSLLADPQFSRYWSALKLSSNKYKVIRRGERGFSRAMLSAGLDVRGLFGKDDFLTRLMECDNAFLRQTLRHAAYVDAGFRLEADALLSRDDGPNWRDVFLAHVRKVLEKREIYSSFPFAMVRLNNYPILKKSNEPVSRLWREAFLGAVAEGALPVPLPVIQAEARAR